MNWFFSVIAIGFLAITFMGCPSADSVQPSASPSPSASSAATASSVPGGPRAAKIIFKQSSPSGSFDASPSGGTVNTPGSGQSAARVFNADGSLLATGGPSASSWPKWLTSFEIGISGSNNTAAKNADCARFSGTNEDINTLCTFGSSSNVPCGAPAGLFRVSEYDCGRSTITNGSGSSSDGVYLRATFSRDTSILGSGENLMVVLEYAASALNGAPSNPTNCLTNGAFDPTNISCSDFSWQIFMKHTQSETVQPFLLLVPPALAHVDTNANLGGSGVAAKQFIVPFAGDANLTILQLSRIKAIPTPADPTNPYNKACNPSNSTSANNSALCVGMVFYSMTFYRI